MLTDDVRMALKVRSTITDDEIDMWINAAIEEMRRNGIREELLKRETMNSLAKSAVVMYCKANYGFDNADSDRNMERFKWTVMCMINSSMNTTLHEEEEWDGGTKP